MRAGELMYFTLAELIVMMELADGGAYSMIRWDAQPDDIGLVQALASLFQRGLILREGDRLALSAKGRPFSGMKQAGTALLLSAMPSGRVVVCYVGKDAIWLVEPVDEVLTQRFRLQQIERAAICDWLTEAEFLEFPLLHDADAAELSRLFEDELSEPSGSVHLRLERYVNGGPLLCTYEVTEGRGGRLVTRRDDQGCAAEIYTDEALSRMLTECFGEEPI